MALPTQTAPESSFLSSPAVIALIRRVWAQFHRPRKNVVSLTVGEDARKFQGYRRSKHPEQLMPVTIVLALKKAFDFTVKN